MPHSLRDVAPILMQRTRARSSTTRREKRVVYALLLAVSIARAQATGNTADPAAYAVLPRPAVLTPAAGAFSLVAGTVVRADPAFVAVARRFSRDIAAATGFDLRVVASRTPARGAIRLLRITGRDTLALGAEGYTLDVTPAGVTVRAAHAAGAFYALESFRQLLPVAIYRSAPIAGTQWHAAAVHIEDAPRFVWRGAHLGATQTESVSLAPDRGSRLADRDPEVPAPDAGGFVSRADGGWAIPE
jgi:hexosaminidase